MIDLPIRTPRLVVRRFTADDAAALARYRSDPEVARYQSWDAPYPLERAAAILAEQSHLAGQTPGEWVQLAVEVDGVLVGDVAVRVEEDAGSAGGVAEIGYTIDPAAQGRGYATEATGAVVDALLAAGLHRIEAGVDPRNEPSRRVLERLGFRREGLLRRAFRTSEGWVDDERWALLDDDPRPPAA